MQGSEQNIVSLLCPLAGLSLFETEKSTQNRQSVAEVKATVIPTHAPGPCSPQEVKHLLDWASLNPCGALASCYLYAGQPKGYPCPENVLGVPHSTETDMLTLDTVATILMSSDMSGYQESILPVFGGQLTANITQQQKKLESGREK